MKTLIKWLAAGVVALVSMHAAAAAPQTTVVCSDTYESAPLNSSGTDVFWQAAPPPGWVITADSEWTTNCAQHSDTAETDTIFYEDNYWTITNTIDQPGPITLCSSYMIVLGYTGDANAWQAQSVRLYSLTDQVELGNMMPGWVQGPLVSTGKDNCYTDTHALARTYGQVTYYNKAPSVFSATVTGPNTSANIAIDIQPAGPQLQSAGAEFVAVQLPGSANQLYFYSPNGQWVLYDGTDKTVNAYYTGPLINMIPSGTFKTTTYPTSFTTPPGFNIPAGAKLYVGYGVGSTASAALSNMLATNTFQAVHTF